MNRHRIAMRGHDKRWREIVVETRPSLRQPGLAPTPAPLPTPPAVIVAPKRFRLERTPDGVARRMEAIEC